MTRRVITLVALFAVVAGCGVLAACCGDCIKDPPCCTKPK
jgi:hypothetical protein